jgi:oligoribonuclease (3'-5' exoribonuclease)
MAHKHFVTDIETTGTSPELDDILQLAFLETDFSGEYWVPGKEYETILHSDKTPAYKWARDHLSDLYAKSNRADYITPEVHRDYILRFFKDCGADVPVSLMGYNISVFDIPFYEKKGLLKKFARNPENKDEQSGDFHYRVYDIMGVIELAENLFLEPTKEIVAQAVNDDKTISLPPKRKSHDALYDCYRELKTLNGLIYRFRGSRGNVVWT